MDSHQAPKRLRRDETIDNPAILVTSVKTPFNGDSTATSSNAPFNIDEGNINIIKLNRLLDKKDRYASHISFLNNCLEINRVPNGLVISLEPSIGNHDETFRSKWYRRLQDFSMTLMNDIVEYSSKVNEEASTLITAEQETLKQSLSSNEYKEVNETLTLNFTNRKILSRTNKRNFIIR